MHVPQYSVLSGAIIAPVPVTVTASHHWRRAPAPASRPAARLRATNICRAPCAVRLAALASGICITEARQCTAGADVGGQLRRALAWPAAKWPSVHDDSESVRPRGARGLTD